MGVLRYAPNFTVHLNFEQHFIKLRYFYCQEHER